ncbi:MAG: nuclear transport factor 2 family protein [Janthinobacterium lividum]
MDDARIWTFEESLWTGDADHYRALIDDQCLMVLPSEPHVVTGRQAIETVAATPRWARVELSDRQVMRPEEGLIVIAYHAQASRDGGEAYEAFCTTTIRRRAHEDWLVVQHSQLPPLALK